MRFTDFFVLFSALYGNVCRANCLTWGGFVEHFLGLPKYNYKEMIVIINTAADCHLFF